MKKMQKNILLLLLATALLAAGILAKERLQAVWNGRLLRESLLSLEDGDVVTLEQAVPFPWDTVYTFDPYTSRARIEESIGFSSGLIRETVSEGQVQLLFVKGNRVTASVCGYAEALGYQVDFFDQVAYGQRLPFAVRREGALVVLAQKEEGSP